MSSPTSPHLGQHSDHNVTTRSPRNFSKPFASPSSPTTPHSEHEIHDLERHSIFSSWQIPHSTSPPLRRKPSHIDLAATDYGKLSGADAVTLASSRLAPIRRQQQQQQLAPTLLPAFSPEPQQQLPTPKSPSLSSSITTLQSTPTYSPVLPGGGPFDQWQGAAFTQVSSKRKFPFTQAKRLPRRAVSAWCVYAAVIEQGIEKDFEVSDSTVESESDAERGLEEQRIEVRRGRSVRFAEIEKETSSGAEQSTSGEEKDATTGSTYTLSKFKFPQPPGHTWAGSFGHATEPTPPTSPATLHYRGASFDLVNPHASLLLGKNEIETPAEIDGLLDDYFTSHTEMSSNGGQESSHSLGNSQDGSKRGRLLYADAESARRTIMRLPSAPLTETRPLQESPLAGKSHASTQGPAAMASIEEPVSSDTQHAHEETTALSSAQRVSSAYASSLHSDPFDLYLSDDEEGSQRNNIDSIVRPRPRETTGVYDQAQMDGDAAAWEEDSDLTEHEPTEAEAEAYWHERESTIGNIVDAYDHTAYPSQDDASYGQSIEHGRDRDLEEGMGNMSTDDQQQSAYGTRQYQYQYARHSPPGLPVPQPPGNLLFYYDCSDLPTSEQTYGATGELLQVTPPNNAGYGSSYPHPGTETYTSMPQDDRYTYDPYPMAPYNEDHDLDYPPILSSDYQKSYDPTQDGYKQRYIYYGPYNPYDNKEIVPPSDSVGTLQQHAAIPSTWSNADLPPSHRASLEAPRRRRGPVSTYGQNNPPPQQRSHEDDDDLVWVDIDPADDPEENMQAAQRDSQLSYANTSDSGHVCDQWEYGAMCCMPSVPKRGRRSLQATRLADGTVGHPQYIEPAPLERHPQGSEESYVKEAIVLIKQVMREKAANAAYGVEGSLSGGLRENRMWEMKLRKMKDEHLRAVQDAADHVALDVPNMMPDLGCAWSNGYDPHDCFQKLMKRLKLDTADTHELPKLPRRPRKPYRGFGESVQRLLEEPPGSCSTDLAYSNTFASFSTVKPASPRVHSWLADQVTPQKLHLAPAASGRAIVTPFNKPHFAHSPAETLSNSLRTGRVEEYELHELTRFPRSGAGALRPAMSGQTSLRPLQLGATTTTAASSTTSFVPGRRMTDADLMRREPGWRMGPSTTTITTAAVSASPSAPRTALELSPADAAMLDPRLMSGAEAQGREHAKERRRISQRAFCLAALCPVSAALFGMGYLDGVAEWWSEGRVVEGMEEEDRVWALWVAVPLGALFWAMVVVVVVIVVKVVV
ncbi:hypothetical protein LTR02_000373 [Friedmanniomyces endolithicus]|nr:hypothetical protein LTR75_013603 [Friedmanniomyces endolithicus]KAK0917043.1 hypothetical protein LTR02_000373 [Friedmanniomyces endolithicus]KAK0998711.1 hypothetical protein LTS01_005538 [Friedmanniomyces endolithicus]